MGQTMRAVDIQNGAGPPSALFINPSVPKPSPSASECLVRVKAFGLNRADTIQRAGAYPPPPGASTILGLEFSGVIEEVGKDANDEGKNDGDWKVGDEVFGLLYGGGYAEYVVANKGTLIAKPANMSWEYAAGVCEVWFTALQALHLVGGYTSPATTRSILWHAGASSVSIAGIQLSRHLHKFLSLDGDARSLPPPKVYATSRTDSKCTFCTEVLHCDAAVNTKTTPNWAQKITSLNGDQGVDLVIDYTGASYFQGNLDVIARDGRIVLLGLLGGSILLEKVDISAFLRKRARLEGSTLRSRDIAYQTDLRNLFVKTVLPGLLDGTFEHHIDRVFKWEDIRLAHELLERNETKGKVVCTIDW
ncbi:hypothetical protein VTO42DRAFT_2622 [Malbranchea cinnamomea]